ncbi:Zinc finger CCCH domain-containing protein 7A [Quaeritorhiza haematococci]|nr:Zinc finger CCCH domain-containing protein 7A [Quaeritorhiza haematococci]
MLTAETADFDVLKSKATTAFRQKDFTLALSLYDQCLHLHSHSPPKQPPYNAPANDKKTLKAILHANKSACFLSLNDPTNAALEAKHAITLDPLYIKPYYRLALALEASVGVDIDANEDAEAAAAVAVALTSESDGGPVRELYRRLTGKSWRLVRLVRSSNEVNASLMLPQELVSVKEKVRFFHFSACQSRRKKCPCQKSHITLIVVSYATGVGFQPNRYTVPIITTKFTIICIVDVTFESFGSHTISICSKGVSVRNIRFKTKKPVPFNAILVDENSELHATHCHMNKWPGEVGMLVHKASALLRHCVIENAGKQAIEMRQDGSLDMHHTRLSRCKQGVLAYGGARHVGIFNSSIQQMRNEGILAIGTHRNPATLRQERFDRPKVGTTKEVVDWGNRAGVHLDVVIANSQVSDSGMYGLSLDLGADVIIHKCTITDNKPFGILIKGETRLSMTATQIIHGNREVLHVGVNYGGNIFLRDTVFVGEQKAIVDEMQMVQVKGGEGMRRQLGWWTKSAVQVWTRICGSVKEMPLIEDLSRDTVAPPLKQISSSNVAQQRGSRIGNGEDLALTHRQVTHEWDPYF